MECAFVSSFITKETHFHSSCFLFHTLFNLHKNPLLEDGKKINAIFHSQFHPCSPLCLEHTKVTNGLNTNSFSKRLQH